jgi:hypothetical protein
MPMVVLLVVEQNCFEVQIAIERCKRFRSPGIGRFLQNILIQRCIDLLTVLGIKKNCHSNWNMLLYVIRTEIKLTTNYIIQPICMFCLFHW